MNATCPQNYRVDILNPDTKTVPSAAEFTQQQTYATNTISGISPNGYYSQAEIRQASDNKPDAYTSYQSSDKYYEKETAQNTIQTSATPQEGVNGVPSAVNYVQESNEGVNATPSAVNYVQESNEGVNANSSYDKRISQNNEEVKSDSSSATYNAEDRDSLKDTQQAANIPENKNSAKDDNFQVINTPENNNTEANIPSDGTTGSMETNGNPDSKKEYSDLSASEKIIEELDVKNAEQKALEANVIKTKVVALTNEYIMSLENYLNNPNTDIRLMASKEILTRFDEDHDRYDDAALNALLNKMLQDPSKLIRIAALSALSSDLASGNNYTIELLNKIQQNPDSDKQDVLDAAQILLNRSAKTEVKYIRQNNEKAEK